MKFPTFKLPDIKKPSRPVWLGGTKKDLESSAVQPSGPLPQVAYSNNDVSTDEPESSSINSDANDVFVDSGSSSPQVQERLTSAQKGKAPNRTTDSPIVLSENQVPTTELIKGIPNSILGILDSISDLTLLQVGSYLAFEAMVDKGQPRLAQVVNWFTGNTEGQTVSGLVEKIELDIKQKVIAPFYAFLLFAGTHPDIINFMIGSNSARMSVPQKSQAQLDREVRERKEKIKADNKKVKENQEIQAKLIYDATFQAALELCDDEKIAASKGKLAQRAFYKKEKAHGENKGIQFTRSLMWQSRTFLESNVPVLNPEFIKNLRAILIPLSTELEKIFNNATLTRSTAAAAPITALPTEIAELLKKAADNPKYQGERPFARIAFVLTEVDLQYRQMAKQLISTENDALLDGYVLFGKAIASLLSYIKSVVPIEIEKTGNLDYFLQHQQIISPEATDKIQKLLGEVYRQRDKEELSKPDAVIAASESTLAESNSIKGMTIEQQLAIPSEWLGSAQRMLRLADMAYQNAVPCFRSVLADWHETPSDLDALSGFVARVTSNTETDRQAYLAEIKQIISTQKEGVSLVIQKLIEIGGELGCVAAQSETTDTLTVASLERVNTDLQQRFDAIIRAIDSNELSPDEAFNLYMSHRQYADQKGQGVISAALLGLLQQMYEEYQKGASLFIKSKTENGEMYGQLVPQKKLRTAMRKVFPQILRLLRFEWYLYRFRSPELKKVVQQLSNKGAGISSHADKALGLLPHLLMSIGNETEWRYILSMVDVKLLDLIATKMPVGILGKRPVQNLLTSVRTGLLRVPKPEAVTTLRNITNSEAHEIECEQKTHATIVEAIPNSTAHINDFAAFDAFQQSHNQSVLNALKGLNRYFYNQNGRGIKTGDYLLGYSAKDFFARRASFYKILDQLEKVQNEPNRQALLYAIEIEQSKFSRWIAAEKGEPFLKTCARIFNNLLRIFYPGSTLYKDHLETLHLALKKTDITSVQSDGLKRQASILKKYYQQHSERAILPDGVPVDLTDPEQALAENSVFFTRYKGSKIFLKGKLYAKDIGHCDDPDFWGEPYQITGWRARFDLPDNFENLTKIEQKQFDSKNKPKRVFTP